MARGFVPPRGGNQMQQLLQQAQKAQREMQAAQEALEQQSYTATAGGGAVSAVISGKGEVVSVTITPAVVDPDDIEMLQDLVVAAVNEGLRQRDEARQQALGSIAGGMAGLL